MLYKTVEKIKKKAENLYEEPVTFAFLGDSVTQGCFELYKISDEEIRTVYDGENSFASYLRKIFSFLYPTVNINVINAGIAGDGAESGLERLERTVLKFHPDLVVVGYALNDCKMGSEYKEMYKRSLYGIFEKVHEIGADCIFVTPNMMNTHISPFVAQDKNDIMNKIAVECMQMQNEGMLAEYIETAKEAANENGVTVCDIYEYWRVLVADGVNTTELLANKVNHPVKEMNWLTAVKLAETILK